MKIICDILGGSHLYGLNTEDSDVDRRGVFLNTEVSKIIGIEKETIFKKETEDTLFFEFSHFLKSLKKTNTQVLELLFADEEDFILLTEEFKEVRKNKYELVDSERLFSSLIGYIENEKRLANGERKGNLGGKRKLQLDKFGFSPKNFTHLFRLAKCGTVFFEKEIYPTNIMRHDPELGKFLLSIKTTPEKFNCQYLNILADKAVSKLKNSFEKRKNTFNFNIDYANNLCLKFYIPFLK